MQSIIFAYLCERNKTRRLWQTSSIGNYLWAYNPFKKLGRRDMLMLTRPRKYGIW